MNNYYVIATEENDEFNTRNRIKRLYPIIDLLVPVEKNTIVIDGRKFITFVRLMPDYILAGAPEITIQQMNQINKVKSGKGVAQVLADRGEKGLRPAAIEKSEASRFIKKQYNPINNDFFKQDDIVNILTGQFAGFAATIKQIDSDEVRLVVSVKHRPEITLPVWQIGKEEVK